MDVRRDRRPRDAAVFRFDPPGQRKEYRPVHRTAEGWAIGDPPGQWPLYRLRGLTSARRIYICEGEKAADRAREIGATATTSAHGAKSAHKTDWRPLAGREVVILPDHDTGGEAYASDVVAELAKLEPRPTVRIVRLADLWRTKAPIPEGGDMDEWLRDGVPHESEPETCLRELERVADLAPLTGCDPPSSAEIVTDEGGWGPIRLGSLPPSEPFPLDVLPGPARDLAEAAARSISCPVDFPALGCLAAASGAIGRSVVLQIKDGYLASAALVSGAGGFAF